MAQVPIACLVLKVFVFQLLLFFSKMTQQIYLGQKNLLFFSKMTQQIYLGQKLTSLLFLDSYVNLRDQGEWSLFC